MSEGNSGASPQGIPPSFIPSGNRRRRTTSPVARTAAAAQATTSSEQAAPPSFSPASTRRAAGSAGTPAAPATGAESIPSFTPGQGSPSPVAPRRTAGSTQHASSASSRSTASSHGSMRVPAASSNAPANPARTPMLSGRSAYAASEPGGARPSGQATVKRHHPGKIIAAIFAALLVVALLASFTVWNWVDGQLNKESWLSSKASDAGTSWLLLGSDQRDGEEAKSITGFRTDTILVLTKPNSGASSLISIPRDSLVQVNGTYMKINAVAQAAGRTALVEQVEAITGQKIDHVAQIRFNGLKDVVDALGGVELCYDSTVNDVLSGLNWQAGCHVADGTTALAFSRMRYSDPKGDFGRAERQRQVIGAIAKKATSSSSLTNPALLTKVAKAGLQAVTVDEKTNPYTLLQMMLTFRAASSDKGVTGSVYWTDPNYMLAGVGSSVLLDDAKNLELFSQLSAGSHAAGTVGTLAG
ncbi:transcriptional regulator [Bifidobacterium goeldii]|uniref:Transcriptional regulator n=1 Tax=Bifidobacterium goeldii TaxID=2306975 RepID=A0A430FM54_9BIFI|nr:LCP family protein [Bifidobacterium goeldii]RSX54003.1 transcriptional regulator [Bifidobacterium goeldii]